MMKSQLCRYHRATGARQTALERCDQTLDTMGVIVPRCDAMVLLVRADSLRHIITWPPICNTEDNSPIAFNYAQVGSS